MIQVFIIISRRILFTVAFLFIYILMYAQQFVFNRVPLFEENTRGFVTAMAQDSKGYMWFTGVNLYRYDGYHIITYKNDPLNPRSIAPSRLECIFIDRQNIIWLGTVGSGLERFDPATGIFTHYRNSPSDASSLSNDIVTTILEDKEGTLWVGTHGGLNRLNKSSGKFTRFKNKTGDSTSLSNDQVRVIYQDKNGTLWIGCGSPYNNETPIEDGGLNRMDMSTGKFTRYMHDAGNPNTLVNNKVRAIFEDSRGNFWVGSFGDGLHLMNRETGTFKRLGYDDAHPEKLSSPAVKGNYHGISFIMEDKAGGLWIGAFLAGLNYYDPKTSMLTRFAPEPDNAKALGENSVWNACFSKDGVLWITTQSNVYKVDPLRKNIPHFQTGGRVHTFYEDAAGIIWMASDSGLIKNDVAHNTAEYFIYNAKNPLGINSNVVIAVYEDRNGRLWAGTDSGLNLLNKSTNKFIRFQHSEQNKNSITDGTILSILQDRQGLLWLGTSNGLDLMSNNGSFKHFLHNPADSNSIGSNTAYKIFEDNAGNLWVGEWNGGGLNLYNKETGSFKHYFRGNNINDIFQSSDGAVWAGTQSGLYRYNSEKDDFIIYTDAASEIGNDNITGITEDDKKNLWLGTQSSIVKLDLHNNETSIYGRKYGITPNSSFDLNAYKTSKGELMFGDGTGYYKFFPQALAKNSLAPQLQITDFKIADESLKQGNKPLIKPLDKTTEIKLSYKQNVFSIDFAGMHYSSIDENRHLYMLEGYDTKWRKAGSEKTAYYFNVPPGDYTFKVKAASSDGVWAEKNLIIIIRPPWWFRWWAYALYAVLAALVIWRIVEYRSRRLIREKKLLWDQVKLRTEQVVKQKEEISIQRDNLESALNDLKSAQAQLVQKEKMASLGELATGIAHEIQNPLNFVNNFSEVNSELISELVEEAGKGNMEEVKAIANDIKDNEEKINQHGKRAEAIVKGMLQHTRFNTGQNQLTDINSLADEYLRLSYNSLYTKDKSFNADFKTDFDKSIGKINIVPQDMGRVLLNLFNNAFYAVNEKLKSQGLQPETTYKPLVSVQTKKLNDKIEIIVRDNGTGIPSNIIEKIFQPFFTTKPTGHGTGLGLSLTYDIIKAHGGEIKVESKQGEGSEFAITLPV